jgi:hypothetical protein
VAAKRLLVLVGGSLLFWLLVAIPARYLGGGDAAVVYSLSAVAICLIPTVGTLYWGTRTVDGPAEQQLALVMGGTGVRMFFVLLAGLALYKLVPYYEAHEGFWIWLLVFYLFTLGLEMFLLLYGRSAKKT